MRIEKYPLTENYYIIVFEGGRNRKFSLSNSGTVCEGNFIDTTFSNRRYNLEGYKMFGRILDKEESYFSHICPKKELISFLERQGYEVTQDTWMLCPKPPKKLKGVKMKILFNLGNPNFMYGESEFRELDVYMTPITNTTKSVTFSVMIPEHIYNACSLDPQEDLRPKFRHIESESLSFLHSTIKGMYNQAFYLAERERESKKAKKVICINFNSSENTERDGYNFGYTGQKVSVVFNFYVCYHTGKEYYTYNKVDGKKGVLDNTASGLKSYIKQNPKVVIDWTQEREDFLLSLEDNFRKLSNNLNGFLKDLDSDKLDLLVSNSELLQLKA